MKRLLYLLAYLTMVGGLMLLAGCASAPTLPREVLTPVASCPIAELDPRPVLPIGYITDATAYNEKEKAYVESLDLLTTYAAGLEAQLQKLKTHTEPKK